MDPTGLAETQGALLIGFTLSGILYGVTCCQTLTYLRRYNQDSFNLQLVVVTIWILETAHLALVAHSLYYYMIINHANSPSHEKPVWSIVIMAVPAATAVAITQYVWIMRIWTLNKSPKRTHIAVGMLSLIAADAGFSIAWMINNYHDARWLDVKTHKLWLLLVSIGLITFNDMLATSMLCFTLTRTFTGIQRGDTLVTKVITYSLNTGLLTCIGSLTMLVLITVMVDRLYYTAVYIVFTRLYANSLLAMLNWRRSAREAIRKATAFEFSTIPWGLSVPPEFR